MPTYTVQCCRSGTHPTILFDWSSDVLKGKIGSGLQYFISELRLFWILETIVKHDNKLTHLREYV